MCHSREIHLAAPGRKAWTTKADEGLEREGHVQDCGRKKLGMQALFWEGPWKPKDDVDG